MKYCTKCGKALNDDANFCAECGTAFGGYGQYGNNTYNQNMYNQNMYNQNVYNQSQETSTMAMCALIFAFISPIVGFILGIIGCTKYKTPSYKKMSIAAIIVSVVSWIISFVILMALQSFMGASMY